MTTETTPDFILNGILTCGQCTARMALTSDETSAQLYFTCSPQDRNSFSKCLTPTLDAHRLDRLVVEKVMETVLTRKHLNILIAKTDQLLAEKLGRLEGNYILNYPPALFMTASTQGNRVLIWDTWRIVIPAQAEIQEMLWVGQCSLWQGALDSGFRRNDGLRRDCPAPAPRNSGMLGSKVYNPLFFCPKATPIPHRASRVPDFQPEDSLPIGHTEWQVRSVSKTGVVCNISIWRPQLLSEPSLTVYLPVYIIISSQQYRTVPSPTLTHCEVRHGSRNGSGIRV